MHVISRKTLRAFIALHPDAAPALNAWYRNARRLRWANWAAVVATYNTVDRAGDLAIFDVGGNKFRVVCLIFHRRNRCYIRHVFTHAEYDRWNRDRR